MSDNRILHGFLENFPRMEIIQKLSEIDSKISSLHTISSRDFLYFNHLLKQYYSNIKDISSANNLISGYINNDLPAIKKEIKEKTSLQIALLTDTNASIHKILDYLSRIYSSLDLLVVPFNNYKQNLITLKYILANIKLHLNYIGFNKGEQLQEAVAKMEQNIAKIQKQIELIDIKADKLTQRIVNLKDHSCLLGSIENSDLKEELNKIDLNFKKLSVNEYLPDNSIMDLNNSTQNCFAYMGEVITNIQYHDIIRQKMEHIQTAQSELIKEITQISNPDNETDNQINLILRMPEIADIQVAQLLYTNKDYQTSIEKITNQLLLVGNEMKTLSATYNFLHENTIRFEETFGNYINHSQLTFNSYSEELSKNWCLSGNDFSTLNNEYSDLKNSFNNLFQSEKELRNDVQRFQTLLKNNGENFAHELLNRLKNLFTDLQNSGNSIKTQLNTITQFVVFLHTLLDTYKPKMDNFAFEKASMSNLSAKSDEIKLKTLQYVELSDKIAIEIGLSLKKIEYYKYFKNTVEEIVVLLNEINKKVDYNSLKEIIGNNKVYLEKIEKNYTMKSERDVQELIDSGKNVHQILNNDAESINLDDNDIELF